MFKCKGEHKRYATTSVSPPSKPLSQLHPAAQGSGLCYRGSAASTAARSAAVTEEMDDSAFVDESVSPYTPNSCSFRCILCFAFLLIARRLDYRWWVHHVFKSVQHRTKNSSGSWLVFWRCIKWIGRTQQATISLGHAHPLVVVANGIHKCKPRGCYFLPHWFLGSPHGNITGGGIVVVFTYVLQHQEHWHRLFDPMNMDILHTFQGRRHNVAQWELNNIKNIEIGPFHEIRGALAC